MSRTPNFLFIGPDKAGSTWLYEALRSHRQVYLPPVKELFFFDRFYDKGWAWYEKYFKDATTEHRIVGEICHDYLFSPLACRRIAHDLPDVKLMVCLREPVQRAFSQYLYLLKIGLLNCDFERALNDCDELIDNGRYFKHLSQYMGHFHREQIFAAAFDDLVSNPQAYFDGLCRFLGIECMPLSEKLRETVLPASRPRLRYAARIARTIGWQVRMLGFPGLVGTIKESKLLSKVLYRSYRSGQKPSMPRDAKERLQNIFSPEITRLDHMLGTDFSIRWNYAPMTPKNGEMVSVEANAYQKSKGERKWT